jgi:hypothetical protein
MAWLKRAWETWLGVMTVIAVVLGLIFVGLPALWSAVDQSGFFDVTWTCGDMDSQAEAQEYLERERANGDEASVENLDRGGNGTACEGTDFNTAASTDDGGSHGGCHASYTTDCLDPGASDYDCEGGDGNGPEYVAGPVEVDWSVDDPDPFGLDRDGDGWACEWG